MSTTVKQQAQVKVRTTNSIGGRGKQRPKPVEPKKKK